MAIDVIKTIKPCVSTVIKPYQLFDHLPIWDMRNEQMQFAQLRLNLAGVVTLLYYIS